MLGSSRAARAYVPPPIEGYVTDTAGRLSAEERQSLIEKLARYRAYSKNHVVVFLPQTLGGESIEDVAYGAFNAWKIGEAEQDNGVLLVVAPNDRRVRIETGKGVGGAITDLESSHILRDQVTPNLKKGDYFAAIDEGTTGIERALERDRVGNEICVVPAAKVVGALTKSTPNQQPSRLEEARSDMRWGLVLWAATFMSFFFAFGATLWTTFGVGIAARLFGLWFSLFAAFIASTILTVFLGKAALAIGVGGLALVLARRMWFPNWPGMSERSSGSESSSSSGDSSSSSSSSWGSSGSGSSSSSWGSSSSFGSSSSWDSSSSSSNSDTGYGGGGGSSGGGGASDGW